MKAVEGNFLKFLNKNDQLEVPIYQRTYSWTRPECLQLWSDVVRQRPHRDRCGRSSSSAGEHLRAGNVAGAAPSSVRLDASVVVPRVG